MLFENLMNTCTRCRLSCNFDNSSHNAVIARVENKLEIWLEMNLNEDLLRALLEALGANKQTAEALPQMQDARIAQFMARGTAQLSDADKQAAWKQVADVLRQDGYL